MVGSFEFTFEAQYILLFRVSSYSNAFLPFLLGIVGRQMKNTRHQSGMELLEAFVSDCL